MKNKSIINLKNNKMNRQIKFRAWVYRTLGGVNLNEMVYESNKWLFEWQYEGAGLYLMQFTGLHDKNGKEIYEGDIYKTSFGIYKVMFVNGAFVGGKSESSCIPIEWEADDDDIKESNFANKVEIIGNIYENPELCS